MAVRAALEAVSRIDAIMWPTMKTVKEMAPNSSTKPMSPLMEPSSPVATTGPGWRIVQIRVAM